MGDERIRPNRLAPTIRSDEDYQRIKAPIVEITEEQGQASAVGELGSLLLLAAAWEGEQVR